MCSTTVPVVVVSPAHRIDIPASRAAINSISTPMPRKIVGTTFATLRRLMCPASRVGGSLR